MTTPQYTKFVTPAGKAIFPWLQKADTKFANGGAGKYHVVLAFDEGSDEATALENLLTPILSQYVEEIHEAKAKYKRYSIADLFEEEYDDETGEPTGRVLFKFVRNAGVKDRKTGQDRLLSPPALFDSKGKNITDDCPPIWSGSTLCVAGFVKPYAMDSSKTIGLSLKMDAVMVKELVSGSGGGQSADEFGFESSEGGFEVTTDAQAAGVDFDSFDDDGDDEDEF